MTDIEKLCERVLSPPHSWEDAHKLARACRELLAQRESLMASLNSVGLRADAATAQVEALREALDRYGDHTYHCHVDMQYNPGVCTCGYDDALAATAPKVTS